MEERLKSIDKQRLAHKEETVAKLGKLNKLKKYMWTIYVILSKELKKQKKIRTLLKEVSEKYKIKN